MILVMFSAVLTVFSTIFFSFSYSIRGLNKAIICTPIELLFSDMEIRQSKAQLTTSLVKQHLLNYYEKALPKYCKNYSVDFYFYNPINDSMCISDYCDAVDVEIIATLNYSYIYHRVMYYEIRKGVSNG